MKPGPVIVVFVAERNAECDACSKRAPYRHTVCLCAMHLREATRCLPAAPYGSPLREATRERVRRDVRANITRTGGC